MPSSHRTQFRNEYVKILKTNFQEEKQKADLKKATQSICVQSRGFFPILARDLLFQCQQFSPQMDI